MLAYYCMPQVFFYGVHVLAGQVLNARDRFGPMMWAPIANNVVSILVLASVPGRLRPGRHPGPFTSGQELLLGLGATLGIAVQAAVLVPFLRAAGLSLPAPLRFPAHRPRQDLAPGQVDARLRGGHPARAGRGHPAGQQGHRRRSGRRPECLHLRVRGVDPAALADHRLAGDRHAAVGVPAGRGRRPGGGRRRDHPDHPARRHRAAARFGRVPGTGFAGGPVALRLRARAPATPPTWAPR